MKRNSMLLLVSLILILVGSLPDVLVAQPAVSFGQQVAVLKSLKSDLQVLGVMSSTLNEKEIANITRTATQQGLKLFVAQITKPQDIAQFYKKLVSEKKAQIILIPSADDDMMLRFGFDFLKENTVVDKIGLCVPDVSYLSQGAFCFITKEEGKIKAYVNQRISAFVGAAIPKEENPSIDYVVK
ncbi:MAG: hypothetical protein H3C35_01215 [Bacteroidetes bacterium]|nr:hypothetical protein [Bacteroidota bacterium]